MASETRPKAPMRSDYKTFRQIQTRWQDVDIYGHVNNVLYFSYFDTAVNGWYLENEMIDPGASDGVYLVASNACQFFSEIKFPQTVYAGLRLAKIGNSSVRYDIGLFVGEAEQACAQGDYVHIYVDRLTRRPVPIIAAHRALFAGL